ncbi:MAG: hypothetical protein MJ175_00895 [Clostridia bacterium]|nr:hypothetical protein [Clostridia bacterium]
MKTAVIAGILALTAGAAGVGTAAAVSPTFRAWITGNGQSRLETRMERSLEAYDTDTAKALLEKAGIWQGEDKEYLSSLTAMISDHGDRAMEDAQYEAAAELYTLACDQEATEEHYTALTGAIAASGDADHVLELLDEMETKFGTDADAVFDTLYITEEKAATCAEDGYLLYTSRVSSAVSKTVYPATGEHPWDDGVITKEPTCAAVGQSLYTCSVCGLERTEELPLSEEHPWDEGTVLKAVTCAEDGLTKFVCPVCGLEREETVPMTGVHTWDKAVVVKKATCAEAGTQRVSCAVCGLSSEEPIPATGKHTFGAPQVLKAATCSAEGSQRKVCSVCKTEVTEVIPATGRHDYVTQVIKQATCTADGQEKSVCSMCGADTGVVTIAATGHRFGSWQMAKAPTTTADGSEKRVCSVCGAAETRVLAKIVPLKEIDPKNYFGYQYLAKNYPSYLWIYDKLVSGVEALSAEISVADAPTPLKLNDFRTVYYCYVYDHPQHFWLDNYVNYAYINDTITTIKPGYLCSAAEKKNLQTKFDNEVTAILSGVSGSMSDYERELMVHDRIAAKVSYDHTYAAPFNHTAYGALVNGTAVCEGYEELFQYLMYRCGIPAAFVGGSCDDGDHSWTMVWLDGIPYHVDMTWDDPVVIGGGDTISHEYFNCTTAYMKTSGHRFEYVPYTLPECTSTKHSYYTVKGGITVPLTVDGLKKAADEAKANGDGPNFECRLDRIYSQNEVTNFFNNRDNINDLWRYYNKIFGFKSCLITRALSASGTVLQISLAEK